jgi:nitrate/nitrite transporter NarK
VGVPPGVGSGYDRFEVLGVGVRVFKDNVLLGGVVIYGLSILGTSLSTPPLALISVAGLLVGAGIAGTSFGIVLPAIAATVLEEKSGWALGTGKAVGSLGPFFVLQSTKFILEAAG